jgi:hypothetical protein
MTHPAIQAVEERAFELRLTMKEVCQAAGLDPAVWSRAKTRGTIRTKTLRKVEAALDAFERSRAA